jgi:hypothetical protein
MHVFSSFILKSPGMSDQGGQCIGPGPAQWKSIAGYFTNNEYRRADAGQKMDAEAIY